VDDHLILNNPSGQGTSQGITLVQKAMLLSSRLHKHIGCCYVTLRKWDWH